MMYRLILGFAMLVFLGGCLCDPEQCRYPDLFHPGHISQQRDRVHQFDPFIRSDIGPKITGDRPSGALDSTPASQYYSKKQ